MQLVHENKWWFPQDTPAWSLEPERFWICTKEKCYADRALGHDECIENS